MGKIMAIVVFGSISVLFLLTFSITKRRLHLFEGMCIWCFILHLQNIFLGVAGIDFGLLKLSRKLVNFFPYDSIRGVIVPLLILFFLEQSSSESGLWRKTVCWVSVILLLVGIDYLAERLDVLSHSEKWKLWWSFAYYTALVTLAFMVQRLIRHIARREVIL
jgi:hypothetical protein